VPQLSRRAVLAGGLGAAGAAAAGWFGVEAATRESVGRHVSGAFESSAMNGRRTGWTIAYPPGHHANLRVLVALHGRTGNHRDALGGSLHLDRYLARAVRNGATPFAVASVDGGDHSYWHPRRDSDAAAMVVDEFLPLLGRHGLDVSRIGLLGWSMGGYGALYLATVLRRRVAVAVAESPAMWHQAGQSADGAFDDAADFDNHSIWPRLNRLAGIALRIDCGTSDGFAPVTRDLRAALTPTPAGGLEPGGHDAAYWRGRAPAQLAFVAEHLG
jgi:S-formylglutathione hydrolase FrmB